MLLEEPIFYYKELLKSHPKSYFCEDESQVIIGIDCDYLDANEMSFSEFKSRFARTKSEISPALKNASFAGFFGVLGYEIVHNFEKIGAQKSALYEFPTFFYANARAYLHYDKMSKIYDFYGADSEIYENLQNLKFQHSQENKEKFYEILSDESAQEAHFKAMIESAKEKIKSGDIFQVVLGEILSLRSNLSSIDFYERLKSANPSPYMFHFPTPYGDVVGSSPELIMQIKNDEIFVAPIAGTRPRGADGEEDARLEADLLSDEKELAEHKMLIDLARNDIGKFAAPRSVHVANPMHIKKFESVMHIVSEVYGTKPKDISAFDVLSVVFPAGTLSGSPKIRAMQIINELESSARGIYGGGIGFWRFNGDVLQAILIRSAFFEGASDEQGAKRVFIGAGAGIVYDSVPANEYLEICNKRKSCLKIFEQICKEVR